MDLHYDKMNDMPNTQSLLQDFYNVTKDYFYACLTNYD